MAKTGWTQKAAIAELEDLALQTKSLARDRRYSENHMRWVVRTLEALEEIFGRDSRYYLTFSAFTWTQKSGVIQGWDVQAALEQAHQNEYLKELQAARGLLVAAREYLERRGLGNVFTDVTGASASSTTMKLMNLIERGLRKTIRTKPDAERAVQDAFENILIGAQMQYSREAERIEYSTKTCVPDVTVAEINSAIEIKLCAREGREKELIDEIGADISAYRLKYKNLFFVVYDTGFVRDADRFIAAFETAKDANVVVRIVKH